MRREFGPEAFMSRDSVAEAIKAVLSEYIRRRGGVDGVERTYDSILRVPDPDMREYYQRRRKDMVAIASRQIADLQSSGKIQKDFFKTVDAEAAFIGEVIERFVDGNKK